MNEFPSMCGTIFCYRLCDEHKVGGKKQRKSLITVVIGYMLECVREMYMSGAKWWITKEENITGKYENCVEKNWSSCVYCSIQSCY